MFVGQANATKSRKSPNDYQVRLRWVEVDQCKGTYKRGFKPLEEVPKETPLAVRKRRNAAYLANLKKQNPNWSGTVYKNYYPFPEVAKEVIIKPKL